ncbi:MAG: FAD-binding protein [Clostridiales bacterium]|nr:FAD-binding protein [Clostridiales bacterium]
MNQTEISVDGYKIPVTSLNTVVVGSGAAGYNAACRLKRYGQSDIAIITEDVNAGTSRNAGSDKQTYYKLTLSGRVPDSVGEMAQTLFEGQCVDGDLAYVEAALSTQCFYRLVELGVPFPCGRHGDYTGYKTDHDPRRRASSAGPYTSKMMTESLEMEAKSLEIQVFDHMQAIKIIAFEGEACGLLCLNTEGEENIAYHLFNCKNIILATGGPAGIYSDICYPEGQCGATGLAFEAGCVGSNLTEWQYGLASLSPRWNVSGTYMQALPRFISTQPNGSLEREFLAELFENQSDLHDKIFLKGYQWPFDARKANGSSLIDLLVHNANRNGRRVFLDYRQNPTGLSFSSLSPESLSYLESAGACFGTPFERLLHMNEPAVSFYLEKGVDLSKDLLEISVCAQHNNGGISVDRWWQTNVLGIFAAGECAGTHGVYRPGGSALNAGQVGSMRAAQYAALKRSGDPMPIEDFKMIAKHQAKYIIRLSKALLENTTATSALRLQETASTLMSNSGGPLRNRSSIEEALTSVKIWSTHFRSIAKAASPKELSAAFKLRSNLLAQIAYLSAMLDFIDQGSGSHGSAIYSNPDGQSPHESLPKEFRFIEGSLPDLVQETRLVGCDAQCSWRKVRPIPQDEDFFENVWKRFRADGNVF